MKNLVQRLKVILPSRPASSTGNDLVHSYMLEVSEPFDAHCIWHSAYSFSDNLLKNLLDAHPYSTIPGEKWIHSCVVVELPSQAIQQDLTRANGALSQNLIQTLQSLHLDAFGKRTNPDMPPRYLVRKNATLRKGEVRVCFGHAVYVPDVGEVKRWRIEQSGNGIDWVLATEIHEGQRIAVLCGDSVEPIKHAWPFSAEHSITVINGRDAAQLEFYAEPADSMRVEFDAALACYKVYANSARAAVLQWDRSEHIPAPIDERFFCFKAIHLAPVSNGVRNAVVQNVVAANSNLVKSCVAKNDIAKSNVVVNAPKVNHGNQSVAQALPLDASTTKGGLAGAGLCPQKKMADGECPPQSIGGKLVDLNLLNQVQPVNKVEQVGPAVWRRQPDLSADALADRSHLRHLGEAGKANDLPADATYMPRRHPIPVDGTNATFIASSTRAVKHKLCLVGIALQKVSLYRDLEILGLRFAVDSQGCILSPTSRDAKLIFAVDANDGLSVELAASRRSIVTGQALPVSGTLNVQIQALPCVANYLGWYELPEPITEPVWQGIPLAFGRGQKNMSKLRVLAGSGFLRSNYDHEGDRMGLSREHFFMQAGETDLQIVSRVKQDRLIHLDEDLQWVEAMDMENQTDWLLPKGHHLVAGHYLLRYA